MATDSGGNRQDEVKTQFAVREGIYQLSPLSEYSRPNRTNFIDTGSSAVAVSFSQLHSGLEIPERICFNVGKELYVYPFKGLKKATDLTQPTDKRIYKGTFPTCHAFSAPINSSSADDSVLLLVGFSAGQVQLIDLVHHETNLLFNQERTIEKSKVTCIAWLPESTTQFIVSHASGSLYVYSYNNPCPPIPPTYQVFKQGDSHVVFNCKTKTSRNPMFRWMIGDGAIYQFEFSPCQQYLAVVSQDGFLRIFDYNRMELVGQMRSYFGGLHCVSWSPDGKYLATGGEDDLITVFSFHENRVICRGRGHRSWVTSISFDPYTTSTQSTDNLDYHSDDEPSGINPVASKQSLRDSTRSNSSSRFSMRLDIDGNVLPLTTYRIGSVAQDTYLCLWDITSDILHSHLNRNRSGSHIVSRVSAIEINTSLTGYSNSWSSNKTNSTIPGTTSTNSAPNLTPSLPSPSQPTLGNGVKAKRNFTLSHKDKNSIRVSSAMNNLIRNSVDNHRLLGSQSCPRLDEIPLLEPLTCKKLAHTMLTSIHFYKDFLAISSQDGVVHLYARPHKQHLGTVSNESSDVQLARKESLNSSYPSNHVNGDADGLQQT